MVGLAGPVCGDAVSMAAVSMAVMGVSAMEPRCAEWDGEAVTPELYVVSRNVHRRHLTRGQCAVIAVRIMPLPQPGAVGRKHAGVSADGLAGGRRKKTNPPIIRLEGFGSSDSNG